GGFYFTGQGNEMLIIRNKEIYDGALPSGNSVAALNLLRLARMTGNVELEKRFDQLMRSFSSQVVAYPQAYTHFMMVVDFMIGPGREIVIAGNPAHETTQALIEVVRRAFLPNKVLLLHSCKEDEKKLSEFAPFVEVLIPRDQHPVVYICEQFMCQVPIQDISELKAVLIK
ncbi:MAG: thioredoxin domain-containing protein, partial [Thermodesulfobacteriota bacterium]|nr:thioredoxin domain-containing protein [Thermodesulfobacteriota bacterium]